MRNTKRSVLAAFALTLVMSTLPGTSVAASAPSTRCPLPRFGPGAGYHPVIDPARFGPRITNRWLPMRPGTTFVYRGVKDGKPVVDIVVITRRIRMVDGVRTRIVADRLFEAGVLSERTSDYYAQDACGNVWYFGEDTAELDSAGHVTDRSGSFHAGVDGAQPGVFMQAHPQIGRRFRQEWYRGEAEDTFVVRSLTATITVPYGSFHHAMRTEESTRLEPGVLDNKYYVQGIGVVREVAVQGPTERLALVDVIR